jgi:hypothetical protein
MLAGQMGDVQRMTSEQFGNVKQLASNPFQFVSGIFMKKLVRGGIAVGIALLIFEMIQFIISESMKPGRWLDRRFRRIVQQEVLAIHRSTITTRIKTRIQRSKNHNNGRPKRWFRTSRW